jgi:hypothetical protein
MANSCRAIESVETPTHLAEQPRLVRNLRIVSNPPLATKNIWRLRSDLPTNRDQLGDRFKLLPERRARNAVAKAALFGLRTAARCNVDSRRRLQCGLPTFAYARS